MHTTESASGAGAVGELLGDGAADRGHAHDCDHEPRCPSAQASDRDAAHVIAAHPEQGWSLLCNGVVVFEDFGELLPDGQSVAARRDALLATCLHRYAS